MKLAVVVLILLGFLAAGAAVILVQAVQANQKGPDETATVKVLVAGSDLAAMTVLRANNVIGKESPRKGLPQGYLTSPVQAAGRVLSVGVVKDQVLSQDNFISQGNIAAFSTVIPEGMRAFTIALSNRQVVGGWIYPGCTVDILAAFKLPSSAKGEALSTTLLQNLQVMAIGGESVITKKKPDEEAGSKPRSSDSTMAVTLLVDSKQASALQLAVQYGTVAVAMRNPLDQAQISTDGMVLSRGRLAGEAMDPATLTQTLEEIVTAQVKESLNGQPAESVIYSTAVEAVPVVPRRSTWGVTVIRGQAVELEEFDASVE
ncbi:Flp pilus assembly protein CpaB [Planctomycetota bacterium]